MYITLTTRCNMTCAHCCGDYGPEGEDMSMETFKQALRFAGDYGEESLALGGGEPTLHPQFWEMLGLAILWGFYVWLATNGSRKEDTFQLLDRAVDMPEKLSIDLSLDRWHNPIDHEVVDRFRMLTPTGYPREGQAAIGIRTIPTPIRSGRAKQLPDGQTMDGCTCPGWIIHPNGSIKACGCEDSPVLGDVFDGIDHEKYPYASSCDCWDDWEEMEEMDQTG
jgi:hypothetical protein